MLENVFIKQNITIFAQMGNILTILFGFIWIFLIQ